ncbi:hypothetical protein IMW82_02860 [Rhodanobacter sp. B2A1Ga4]|uniref:hypothetical protein n=1 Tax=Rhodanobacter sp. B2A1Ga4 TaxID=2778647 RepID=UPI001B35B704|nr:hypothetical protein [Rhodanobacter sp. B2A1Ga4]MBQ4853618.1 hypothetical protein [Rhodanobacter sp. B2A1Ga4]
MPQETRDFLLGLLRLLLRRFASCLKPLKRLAIASLGCFEALLPLLGLLPGAVDFLMRAILDGSNVRRGALPFLIRGDEASGLIGLKGLDLARLPISHRLQAIPLLDQIFPEGVAEVWPGFWKFSQKHI